ncbi:response regulator [Saccharicrinis aurantiacus]|uniref:response regulator n=1 Tax=Saccharicrinis aurantiacus TaxID=1849719 RepID=UPI000838B547|nr:response regulator [Saccharicrinis aurantiacus]
MKKVLIVEDAMDSRVAMSKVLSKFNIEVLEAENGREAWDIIIKHHPHLILMDVHIPEIDGLDILKEMKAEWIETPVVMLSGDESTTIRESCFILGAKQFINKPIRANDLKNIVNEYI